MDFAGNKDAAGFPPRRDGCWDPAGTAATGRRGRPDGHLAPRYVVEEVGSPGK